MQRYEFQVVPAPRRGEKARGARTSEERFALALTRLMNRMGAEGWDYVRADTLPCDERAGLRGVRTTFQNMLVFRRPLAPAMAEAGDGPVTARLSGAAGRPNGAMAAPLRAPPPDPPLAAPHAAPAAVPAADAAGGRAGLGDGGAGKALPRLRLEAPATPGRPPPALGPANGPAGNGRD